MKVTVVIECDEYNEICQHLDKIRKDIKKSIVKGTIETVPLDFFDDNNCYGTHTVTISLED